MSRRKKHKHSQKQHHGGSHGNKASKKGPAPGHASHGPASLMAGALVFLAVILAVVFLASRVLGDVTITPSSSERQIIEQTLRMMESAVRTGDARSYLQSIDPSDPVFEKEQQNWAEDLASNTPVAFSLELAESQVRFDTQGYAIVDLTMNWEMAKNRTGSAAGRSRKITYPARFFIVPDGPALYAGRAWERLEAPGVLVLFDATLDKPAKIAAELYPDLREHIQTGFELKLSKTQEIKLYPTTGLLQASIYLSYDDPLGGWNEPGESIKLVGRPNQSTDELRILLAHELGHVATFTLGSHVDDTPWWVLEGIAELASESFNSRSKHDHRMVRSWVEQDKLVSWDQLADFRTVTPENMGHVYVQGHEMLGFVSERFGRSLRNHWLKLMLTGTTLEKATAEALNLSFDELDQQFKASFVESN